MPTSTRSWGIHVYILSPKIGYKNCYSSAGSSKQSLTGSKPKSTSKEWKLKLEQYYSKKPVIKYVSKECPKGGFESTVYCPDIGYAEGEGPTKSAAENNAAYNAVNKLEMSSDPSS